jgi:hypothetical protein
MENGFDYVKGCFHKQRELIQGDLFSADSETTEDPELEAHLLEIRERNRRFLGDLGKLNDAGERIIPAELGKARK